MTSDAYESLIRRAYEDFEAGDLDLLRVVMDEHVVWHEPGRSPLAGDYRGVEAVLGLLQSLRTHSGDTFRIEVLDILSEPERAVVFQRESASRGEKSLDDVAVLDYEIHNQKITEVTVYHEDLYQFDSFWTDR
jgi:uncharacterized protein